MRVIHITNDVAAASGVGTFVRRINDELKQLGVDSSIVTDIADLSTVQPFNSSTLILHIHGIWLGLHHAAAKWAREHGAKLVWSTHGMTAPWAMHHKWWKKYLAWIAYQKRDLKSADLVHSTSEQEVEWNAGLGVKRQCVVPLGTDLPESEFNAGRFRRHAELRSTCVSTPLASLGRHDCVERSCPVSEVKTLLFVGRVYPVKALDRLITAFALAVADKRHAADRDDPPYRWRLRIVGPDEGGHLNELKKLVNSTLQLQLRTSTSPVDFTGPKYGAELEAEYANCDALALVSHTENFGATVVDALAHGKPVITSTKTPWSVVEGGWSEELELEKGRVKSNNQTIKQSNNSRCGWWVENEPEVLAKAIEELMAMSDEERAAMGARGRQLVERQFTWGSVGRRMLAEYEKLIER